MRCHKREEVSFSPGCWVRLLVSGFFTVRKRWFELFQKHKKQIIEVNDVRFDALTAQDGGERQNAKLRAGGSVRLAHQIEVDEIRHRERRYQADRQWSSTIAFRLRVRPATYVMK